MGVTINALRAKLSKWAALALGFFLQADKTNIGNVYAVFFGAAIDIGIKTHVKTRAHWPVMAGFFFGFFNFV